MPVLVRVADADGEPLSRVRVLASWHPSGRIVEAEHPTAAGGLCLIPWLDDQTRVTLTFASPSLPDAARAHLRMRRERADGRVQDIRLR